MLSKINTIFNSISHEKDKHAVTLVAVSKGQPVEKILEAYSHGIRDFGESFVQELVNKAKKCPSDIRWHFIGTLQGNKISILTRNQHLVIVEIPNLFMVHSLSSLKHAKIFHDSIHDQRNLKILIQINVSEEPTKGGIAPNLTSIKNFFESLTKETPSLLVQGLMCIDAKMPIDSDCSRCSYATMNSFLNEFSNFSELSMGMSNDYLHALKHNATIIRIGSGIFGPRS